VSTAEASAAPPVASDEVGTELVARARERAGARAVGRDEALAIGLAALVLSAAACCAALLPPVRAFSPLAALVAVAVYAAVSRVEFEVGNGFAYPGQLVLVPMLFAVPPRDVPLIIAAALLLAQLPNLLRGRTPPSHLPLVLVNSAHAIGPAIVLSVGDAVTPQWGATPLYLVALGSQFVAEFIPTASWTRVAWGIPVTTYARSMRVPVLVDASLAPIGLAVAIAADGRIWGVLAVLPLVALLRVFARERQVRIDHALELSVAYRGTAMLLGDVIEADDEYTGSHSRDVVDLALAVADKLQLDAVERRQVEFAALLHDVGKVKIPAEIINKPGPLDEDERAAMKTHTIVGEQMLEQIGGLLGEVGHVVRSCHERWDGAGYPDGLAGDAIPLAARIVCCCDAWSAMTTDRAYRAALPEQEATAELLRCRGTQFDPQVVDALVAVLGA
jgi:putative nucleotidyltransferase with HDIG domain